MTAREDFDAWLLANPRGELSTWLRETSDPDWTATVAHPFTDALAAGTLASDVFARYLVQDYGFVDPFTALLGFAVGRAPAMADRLMLGQFMGMLTSDENTFFERAFDAYDVSAESRTAPSYFTATRDFRALLADTGETGSYAEILAVLVVTEWIYLSWAQRIAAAPDIEPFYREWIGLHDNPEFVRFVGWLMQRLDETARDLPADAFQRVVERFHKAVTLERRFHDACWTGADA